MDTKKIPRILVVEDDPFLLKAYEAKFKRSGLQAEKAHDGEETLVQLKKQKFDLILLDLVMPKMDGFEVLEKIRQDPKLKGTRILVVSNLGQDSDMKRAKELGADEYLVKSDYSLQQIVDLIKKKLNLS